MRDDLEIAQIEKQYDGQWDGFLPCCEKDAQDVDNLLKSAGYDKRTLLKTSKATRANVLKVIKGASKSLKKGDLFVIYYSGHGGQVADINGDEEDANDETWCLHDGQLIDDEIYYSFSSFAEGVRILMISDSCHSGTVTREMPPPGVAAGRSKAMPDAVAVRTYDQHRKFYDDLQRTAAKTAGKAVDPDAALARIVVSPRLNAVVRKFGPAVILISGCQDNQTSSDGAYNGAFTERLLKVWKHGAFEGDYARFHARIVAGMPPDQTPNLFTLGKAAAFLRQRPFKV